MVIHGFSASCIVALDFLRRILQLNIIGYKIIQVYRKICPKKVMYLSNNKQEYDSSKQWDEK